MKQRNDNNWNRLQYSMFVFDNDNGVDDEWDDDWYPDSSI